MSPAYVRSYHTSCIRCPIEANSHDKCSLGVGDDDIHVFFFFNTYFYIRFSLIVFFKYLSWEIKSQIPHMHTLCQTHVFPDQISQQQTQEHRKSTNMQTCESWIPSEWIHFQKSDENPFIAVRNSNSEKLLRSFWNRSTRRTTHEESVYKGRTCRKSSGSLHSFLSTFTALTTCKLHSPLKL